MLLDALLTLSSQHPLVPTHVLLSPPEAQETHGVRFWGRRTCSRLFLNTVAVLIEVTT